MSRPFEVFRLGECEHTIEVWSSPDVLFVEVVLDARVLSGITVGNLGRPIVGLVVEDD
jgi:hypothetical protein